MSNIEHQSLVLQCGPRCLGHPGLGHRRRGIAATPREERAHPPPQEEKRGGHHSEGPNKRDTSTQYEQQRTTPPATHNNTTRPPQNTHPRVAKCSIPHHRPCLPSCLLIIVCCLLLLVSASVLSVLPLFCPYGSLSVCLDVRLFVRMSVSVRLFVSVTVRLRDPFCESTSVCLPQRR